MKSTERMSMPGSNTDPASAPRAGLAPGNIANIATAITAAQLVLNLGPVGCKIEIGVVVGRMALGTALDRGGAIGAVASVIDAGAVTGFALHVDEIDGGAAHAHSLEATGLIETGHVTANTVGIAVHELRRQCRVGVRMARVRVHVESFRVARLARAHAEIGTVRRFGIVALYLLLREQLFLQLAVLNVELFHALGHGGIVAIGR